VTLAVDKIHPLNLLTLFFFVVLVNTRTVYPQQTRCSPVPNIEQSFIQAESDRTPFFPTADLPSDIAVDPCIAESRKIWPFLRRHVGECDLIDITLYSRILFVGDVLRQAVRPTRWI
jgi:hypothetical protein